MKKLYFFLLFSCLLCLPLSKAWAQWVTIPDANFVNWLNTNGYASCMNGNLMDTTCNAVVNATSISCHNYAVYNLTGISYFDNLTTLYCYSNNLSFLPILPVGLTTLDCNYNQLLSLPPLPPNLTYLYCTNNQISSLPSFPNGLVYVDCRNNLITSLPTLPSSLYNIRCGNNQITSLPSLSSLTLFSCYNNLVTTLPPLPNSLINLDCGYNLLTSLPALPNSLLHLTCDANQLTLLPQLPGSLKSIDCSNNQLTVLPNLPMTLTDLSCDFNQLTSLPEFPDSIGWCYINNNPNLLCLPKLKKISVYFTFTGTGITCLPNYGTIGNSNPQLSSLPLCDLFNTNNCDVYWNISGRVYNDANSNCIYNASEVKLGNIKIQLDSAGNLVQQTYTGGEGLYSFDTNTGTYTYTVDTTNLPVLVTCPPSGFQTSVLTAIDSMDYDMDFGMQCKPGFDVGVLSVVKDSGLIFPNNFSRVRFLAGDLTNFYGLQCATGISGVVKIILDGNAAFISASAGAQVPIVNGDTLIYSIADYGAINSNTNFSIIVQTDTSAQAGDAICFDVEVAPTIGDNNISNNTLQHCFTVVNSFDPNTKEVFPSGNIDTTQQWLTYTVQFQNTGTAPAQHIYILDTLSASIDESMFTLLAYSHHPLTQIIGNVVRFNFPNINLPDSTNNEPHSHGYVQYKIKLKNNLPIGTVIQNTANIYFDFNPPITTNTTQNTIVVPTGFSPLSGGEGQGVRLFPNPIKDNILKINFQSPHNFSLQVVLYDITGRKVFSENINSSVATQTIFIPKLSNGIYTCELTSVDIKTSKKLVVMNK